MDIVKENEKRVNEVIVSIKRGNFPLLCGIRFCDRDIVDIYLALFLNDNLSEKFSRATREVKVDYFEANVLTKRLNHTDKEDNV